ncbi:hypothetical protein [Nostoc sp. C052]|uniref:hypothetical protein n=1 Tax=Nostoc sp. C052 TaxID=2576902 RepID=UPI0015C35647|nr:hypothetical protein [Nostoc sp. C052]
MYVIYAIDDLFFKNFRLLVSTAFHCSCDYLQTLLSSGVATAIAAFQDTIYNGN